MYACIDLGVDRATRQLKDHKSRLRDNTSPPTVARPAAAPTAERVPAQRRSGAACRPAGFNAWKLA